MKYVSFSDTEKIEMFDEIAAHFYAANFGQASKADIELMMFNFYIQKMIKDNQEQDGTIDYNKCSDYKISKDLGITQQRVRNLKVKNQLINPIDFEWERAFAKLISNAKFENQKVIINIPDPNLFYEIQNFLEEQGSYIDKQLNSKLLVIRIEYFIDLLVSLEPESNRKEVIKEIKRVFKEQSKSKKQFDEKNIGKTLIDGAVNIITILANISTIASPENRILKALMGLVNKFAS